MGRAPLSRPFPRDIPDSIGSPSNHKRAPIDSTTSRPQKRSKTLDPTSSSILGSLFHADDSFDHREAIDLTMDDSDTEPDSFHDAINIVDTPDSSQHPDGSVSPPAEPSSPSSVSASKAAFNSSHGPSWALFREGFDDSGTVDRIFLPILDPARRQKLNIKQEMQEPEILDDQLPVPGAHAQVESLGVDSTSSADRGHAPPRPKQYSSPFNVVNSHMRVKIMQKQGDGRLAVPWGVQYYLASLASFDYLSLDELVVTTGINALRSESNATSICALLDPANQHLLWESRADTPIMTRRATDRERKVYTELDRESEMLGESSLNGVIGPPGEEMRSYGGCVLFEGRLNCEKVEEKEAKKSGKRRRFGIQLYPPKLGGSCRFSRRFGSQSILRIKLDPITAKDARRFPLHPKTRDIQHEIRELLSRTIQIMGRKYRPFYCKDETVFYLWIGSAYSCPDQPEFDCIWDLIDYHAPFAHNGRSQLGKFIQRVQLGLSTSVPASVIDKITYVADIFGDPQPDTGKAVEMTDGCGIVSLAVMRDIAQHLGYDTVPSAVQARIAGCKGVWCLDPNAEHLLPNERAVRWIQCRASQQKVFFADDKPLDFSQQVMDLLGPSRTFAPSTLSKQIILVLQSNGVPIATFADMQRAELQAIADEISDWKGPSDTVRMRLAAVVERLCKVESLKAKRSTESAEHRAQGMESHVNGKGGDQGLGDDDREIFFGQNGRHLWNGMPVSKHERAYEMLLGGFHPETCSYLGDLLVDIADLAMRKLIKKFAIPVARSAEAMVIPDPTGTLEEGEIQLRFSGENILDPDTRLRLTHVPEGEVLVTRHPCLLPSDVRRVRAVVRPELSMYKDVVVFSIKGQRPLASLLSGGDYDGDLIRVFWEPRLVEPFQNSDVRYADCPFEISDVFDRSEQTVAEFVAQHQNEHRDERDRALIQHLVAGAFKPAVQGLYGAMHLYAAWQFGTWSDEAVDLAHKFCQCMDSSKTGLSIKPEIRIRDSKMYLGDLPEWAYDTMDESDSKSSFGFEDYNKVTTARKNSTRLESVLCALWSEGKKEVGQLKLKLQKQTEKLRAVEDTDLSGAWRQAKSLGRISSELEETMRTHVKVAEESYTRTNARTRQMIEAKARDLRNGTSTSRSGKKDSHSVPLRRVRSEAVKAGQPDRPSGRPGETSAACAVDDLDRNDMSDRLDGTIEVPVALGSAVEVAARFCQWPKAFAKEHIAKMDRLEVERLAKLRASYTYAITYHHKPRFAFEMAWRWIMDLKAEACGQQQAQGSGSLHMPTSTLDLLSLRTKIIRRNHEMSQGRGVEI